jgi:hypothetical protein
MYELNRDERVRSRFASEPDRLLENYQLTDEERAALVDGDIGLLYVMGVNGQLLMHYAAMIGQAWDEYIEAMREGVRQHGQVRAGLYALLKDRPA